jgi:hypothetical protein
MFDSLDDLSSLILVSNKNKMAENFIDNSVKMNFIYSLWKKLCQSL